MVIGAAASAGTRLLRLAEVAVVFLVATLLALGSAGIVAGVPGWRLSSLFPFLITYLLGYGVLGAAALAYLRVVQNTDAVDRSYPSLLDVRDVLTAFVVVIVGVAALAAVAAVTGIPVLHAGSVGVPVDAPLLVAAVPLSLGLGVPAQELLLRNGFQKRLDEQFPTWVAVAVPSLLMIVFALGPFVGAPPLALVVPALAVALASTAIGWVYARSGTLVAAWLLHSALTLTLLSLLYLDATTALELHSIA